MRIKLAIRILYIFLVLLGSQIVFAENIEINNDIQNYEEYAKIETHTNNDEWNLVWSDEFDGNGAPDSEKWSTRDYERHPNDDGPDFWWQEDQVALNGQGQLSIKMNRIENRNLDNDPYDFASGMVRSQEKFEKKYGKFEIRCKLPKEEGWWISFWMMCNTVGNVDGTGKDGTEIDIIEAFGWNNSIHHALHWDGYGEFHKSAGKSSEILTHDEYHTYSLVWTPTEYQFYIDNELSWVTKGGGVSEVPQYIKISGESSTNGWMATHVWGKDPRNATYPDEFLIDYVRVYDYDFGIEEPVVKEHVFLVNNVRPEKEVYELGNEVTWLVDAEGKNLKYQYYLSSKGNNLDITNYAENSSYSFIPAETGYYDLLAFVYDGETIKSTKSKRIMVKEKDLELKNITIEIDRDKNITWIVDSVGDGVKYSFYIIYKNDLIEYVKYNDSNIHMIESKGRGAYKALVYVQDEFGNTLNRFSRSFNVY